jgi:drug/metabolite transporter (DMT)-like permease
MFIWASAIKNSKLSPVHLSALFDVIGALAYFIGFAIFGEKISPIQWVGIVLMVFSIHLINK